MYFLLACQQLIDFHVIFSLIKPILGIRAMLG